MKALFLTRYSQLGGSSRYMVFDYLDFFRQAGIEAVVSPLFDEQYQLAISNVSAPARLDQLWTSRAYYSRRVSERWVWMRRSAEFDVVVLEKEAIPYAPYGIERLLKSGRTKLVTIYDDAMHAYYAHHPSRLIRALCYKKIERIVRLSDHVIVWNEYLGEFSRGINPNVSVVNTGIDLRRYCVRSYTEHTAQPFIIGWIGTPNSFPYLRNLEDVFRELASRYEVELRVVSSTDYLSPNIKVDNRRWSLETEVRDLCSFDIGIMPLPSDSWTLGKSGCKAVQYLGVGVPAVCSPVGMNNVIIQDGANGYLANTSSEWVEKIVRLIENPYLRKQLGLAGRQVVESTYSIQAMAPRLIKILQDVAQSPART